MIEISEIIDARSCNSCKKTEGAFRSIYFRVESAGMVIRLCKGCYTELFTKVNQDVCQTISRESLDLFLEKTRKEK